MPMKDPPHPGRVVRQDCIDALELTVTRAAKLLGVTRQTLSNLVNERAGISAEVAIRPEKLGWSMADHWMRLQAVPRREPCELASKAGRAANRRVLREQETQASDNRMTAAS